MEQLTQIANIIPELNNHWKFGGLALVVFAGLIITLLKTNVLKPVTQKVSGKFVLGLLWMVFALSALVVVLTFAQSAFTEYLALKAKESTTAMALLEEKTKSDASTIAALQRTIGELKEQLANESTESSRVSKREIASAILSLSQDGETESADSVFKRQHEEFKILAKSHAEKELRYNKLASDAAVNRGNLALLSNFDLALEMYEQAINDNENNAEAWNGIGHVYFRKADYLKAEEAFYKSLEIAIRESDSNAITVARGNIAVMQKESGDLEKSKATLQKILEEARLDGNYSFMATASNQLGLIEEELNNLDNALNFYNQALSYGRLSGDMSCQACQINNIGSIFEKQNKYQQALDAYKEGLSYAENEDDKPKIALLSINMASVYKKMGDYSQASAYCSKGISLYKETGESFQNIDISHC